MISGTNRCKSKSRAVVPAEYRCMSERWGDHSTVLNCWSDSSFFLKMIFRDKWYFCSFSKKFQKGGFPYQCKISNNTSQWALITVLMSETFFFSSQAGTERAVRNKSAWYIGTNLLLQQLPRTEAAHTVKWQWNQGDPVCSASGSCRDAPLASSDQQDEETHTRMHTRPAKDSSRHTLTIKEFGYQQHTQLGGVTHTTAWVCQYYECDLQDGTRF